MMIGLDELLDKFQRIANNPSDLYWKGWLAIENL